MTCLKTSQHFHIRNNCNKLIRLLIYILHIIYAIYIYMYFVVIGLDSWEVSMTLESIFMKVASDRAHSVEFKFELSRENWRYMA